MLEYCPNCGIKLNENAKFCINCGTNFEKNHVQTPRVAPIILPPEKSNKKIKASIVIIIVIIIIAIVFLVLFNYRDAIFDGGDANKIIGTWEGTLETSAGSFIITFLSDGTYNCNGDTNYISGFIYAGVSSGNWELDEGKIIIHPNNGETVGVFTYHFFDDDQKLNLTQTSTGIIINLIK